jgi:hypothetical protein
MLRRMGLCHSLAKPKAQVVAQAAAKQADVQHSKGSAGVAGDGSDGHISTAYGSGRQMSFDSSSSSQAQGLPWGTADGLWYGARAWSSQLVSEEVRAGQGGRQGNPSSSSAVARESSAQQPAHERQQQQQQQQQQELHFTVASYNILADKYARQYSSWLYSQVPAAILSWGHR